MTIDVITKDGSKHLKDPAPLQPNMLVANAKVTSSTFVNTDFTHSVLTEAKFFNTRFHESNFEGTAYDNCDFDGSVFAGCSFRGVELINCDVDRMVINGVNIGNLLRLAMGEIGGLKK